MNEDSVTGDPTQTESQTQTRTQTQNQATDASRRNGPRVSGDQMRDVTRLRRSTHDRHIAGVAGGLGRHFDVDPTVVRVVLVVLTLFGGAGLLVYGAVWLFVADDSGDRAPIEVSSEVLRIILIAVAVIALSIVFGTPFFGNGWGGGLSLPFIVVLVVGVALFVTRGHRRSDRVGPPPPWGSVPPSTTNPYEGPTMTTSTGTRPDAYSGGAGSYAGSYAGGPSDPGQPPAWMPPSAPRYVPPPRPRRTGMFLFWPTLALIAIALGTLGIFDTSSSITISAYAALAVAITGVMLLVGAFVGRPGGLIALGLVSCVALLVTSAIGAATGANSVESKDLREVPTSAAAVLSDYHLKTGTIEVDLTEVADVAALNGRTIELGVNAGEVIVYVPQGLNVHVDGNVRYAGQIDIGDDTRGGLGMSYGRTIISSTAPGTPTLDLDINVRVGHIQVTQR